MAVMYQNSIALFSTRFDMEAAAFPAGDRVELVEPNGAPAIFRASPPLVRLRWESFSSTMVEPAQSAHLLSRYLPTSSMPLVSGFRPMKEDGWLPTS